TCSARTGTGSRSAASACKSTIESRPPLNPTHRRLIVSSFGSTAANAAGENAITLFTITERSTITERAIKPQLHHNKNQRAASRPPNLLVSGGGGHNAFLRFIHRSAR